MNIRAATSQDVELLSRLNVEIQRLHAQHHPDYFKMPENDDFAVEFYDWILSEPNVRAWIAEIDEEAVGYLLARIAESEENAFMHARRYLYIDQISVCANYQRQGIGAALMAQAHQLAEQEDLPHIALDTWAFNESAQAFFARQGYENFNHRMWVKW